MAAAHFVATLRRERIFRDRTNPLDAYDDVDFVQRYRLRRHQVLDLIAQYELSKWGVKSSRCHAIPNNLQILMTIRFLANGGSLRTIGDLHGVSKATTGQVIHKVTQFLVSISGEHIVFPITRQEMVQKASAFSAVSDFPNVVGAIDGTHIPIRAPPGPDEACYVNRKQFHSLNVQIVCDAEYRILDIVAKYPGSTHDAFMLQFSPLGQALEQDVLGGFWLLGDSGYPCKRYLLTPILHPQTRAEENYNRCHKAARSVVERTIGVWKGRFRAIGRSTGNLEIPADRCTFVIIASAVLHNMATNAGLPVDMLEEEEEDDDPRGTEHDARDGTDVRRRLVQSRFTD